MPHIGSQLRFQVWAAASRFRDWLTAFGLALSSHSIAAEAQRWTTLGSSPADQLLERYFHLEASRLGSNCLAEIHTAADWQSHRLEYRRQLQEMLGLWPTPAKTPLNPVVTGVVERDGVRVEKLHFQSMPGLYVTANLYLPTQSSGPLPTILYVCGHAQVKTNGVSYGNKTAYQHHGAWFAQHGYACLTLDTLQLGEIEGLHHGIYREGRWWWNSRGYTPAGVEAWNSIRALDYLESRPEIDRNRIGMTGRSGGGSYTWTTAALDERIRAAAPVAGITDLHNQVIDGCVEGHCDCMFFVNTYRWDFPLNAALIAPRPLLIVNTDSDTIFPLPGITRLHASARRLYALLGVEDRLGLSIAPGPHKDIQELQVAVFRFFDQHLKSESRLIQRAAEKRFTPGELKVFPADQLPPDQINTRIDQLFVPTASPSTTLTLDSTRQQLRALSFRGWPQEPRSAALHLASESTREGIRFRRFELHSQESVPLWLFEATKAGVPAVNRTQLQILEESEWHAWSSALHAHSGNALDSVGSTATETADTVHSAPALAAQLQQVQSGQHSMAWLAPRGVGPTAWTTNAAKRVQIRRRFMLLGQTLDGMRVWDIRQAIQALHSLDSSPTAIHLAARNHMSINALYASLFEDSVQSLRLANAPASHREGPDYLNVLKVLDIPQALELARARIKIEE